jgi:hypothetical protein
MYCNNNVVLPTPLAPLMPTNFAFQGISSMAERVKSKVTCDNFRKNRLYNSIILLDIENKINAFCLSQQQKFKFLFTTINKIFYFLLIALYKMTQNRKVLAKITVSFMNQI